ncbi:MAG: extracellular solute-binding protein [Propionibacteriaceae bacterium]|nr:extracellular solute-binding protein [Propionibacteriaceae bacterium]
MKNSLRRGLIAALAALMTISLAACGTGDGTGGENAELSDGPVTLRMMWWGGDGRHERTQKAIDAFEAKYPNITVEPEFSDWAGYWDKLATAAAGGNAPDVVQMDQLYLASYASRDTLLDLEKLSQLNTGNLEESVLGMGRWNNTLYAMPISTTSQSFLVNQELIDRIGISLPASGTWTWAEFAAWAKSVSDATNGEIRGTGTMYIEHSLQLFARQRGDALFSTDDIVIKPETLAAFFQTNLDWVKSGAAPSAEAIAEQNGLPLDQLDFSIGKAAALLAPSTQVTAYSQAAGAALTMMPLPSDDDSVKWEYNKPGMYWSATSTSKHPAEAALLIDFLVNDAEVATIFGSERGMPASPKMVDAIRSTLTPTELQAVEFAESRQVLLGEAPPIVPNGAADIQTVINRYAQEVLFERQTPIDAANAMIAEVKAAIQSA